MRIFLQRNWWRLLTRLCILRPIHPRDTLALLVCLCLLLLLLQVCFPALHTIHGYIQMSYSGTFVLCCLVTCYTSAHSLLMPLFSRVPLHSCSIFVTCLRSPRAVLRLEVILSPPIVGCFRYVRACWGSDGATASISR